MKYLIPIVFLLVSCGYEKEEVKLGFDSIPIRDSMVVINRKHLTATQDSILMDAIKKLLAVEASQ